MIHRENVLEDTHHGVFKQVGPYLCKDLKVKRGRALTRRGILRR